MANQEIQDQLKKMIELQSVEMEAREVRSVLENVDQKLKSLEEERATFEAELTREEDNTAELKKAYRAYESDTQAHLSTIAKSKEKLRSVKTNKEYQSILKEIDDIEAKNSEIEDLMLEHLDKIEAAEAAFKTRKSDYALLEQDIEQRVLEIKNDEASQREILDKLRRQREQIAEGIKAEFMKKFQFVRDSVGVMAVAPVVSAVCQGCHMNIPPQLYNELQRFDNLHFCPNCQRIIFWEKNDE